MVSVTAGAVSRALPFFRERSFYVDGIGLCILRSFFYYLFWYGIVRGLFNCSFFLVENGCVFFFSPLSLLPRYAHVATYVFVRVQCSMC